MLHEAQSHLDFGMSGAQRILEHCFYKSSGYLDKEGEYADYEEQAL